MHIQFTVARFVPGDVQRVEVQVSAYRLVDGQRVDVAVGDLAQQVMEAGWSMTVNLKEPGRC